MCYSENMEEVTSPTVKAPFSQTTILRSFKLLNKKQSILLGLIAIVGLIIGISLGRMFSMGEKIGEKVKITQPTISLPTPLPSLTVTPTIVKVETSVEFSKREKIFEPIKIPGPNYYKLPDSNEEYDVYIIDFYKVGTITSGKYNGGALILASVTFNGACKGVGCGNPFRFRFILKDDVAIYLPQVSVITGSKAEKDITEANPFKKFGFSIQIDKSTTIPILEFPKEITGDTPRQVLRQMYDGIEEDGLVDHKRLYKVFTHSIFGDIFTTKPEFSPSEIFISEYEGFGSRTSVGACTGKQCFMTNMFYAFRPDGTFIKFAYKPDFEVEEVEWNNVKGSISKFKYNTIEGCSHNDLDQVRVVSPSLVSDSDLVTIGQIKETDDPVYALKNPNHKLYTTFYNAYKKNSANPDLYFGEKNQITSYEEFINALPIFLWRDPFGRLIQYSNMDFLPPNSCEPIIYLYPTSTQSISISLGKDVKISDSTPPYKNGWKVTAFSNGNIIDQDNNRSYPYLFWEGWSYIFPIQSKGFVVKQNEVEIFLAESVKKLGLNELEKNDFMEAWLPYFEGSPYYFITFLDQNVIDKIAPLNITPRPDTIIRILMDVKPLEHPIDVIEPEFKKTPQRLGFTVVEWGGLKR